MKPVALILDLLRTYSHKGTSVKTIMSTGTMFGFSENLMRVSLSRLVTRHTVEKFKRGYYRLTEATDPLNDFIERWRLGEKRHRPWPGATWNCVHLRDDLIHKGLWALMNNGFREVVHRLWIRPDNLQFSGPVLKRHLVGIGLPETAILMGQASIDESLAKTWLCHFDVKDLDKKYAEMSQILDKSLKQLDCLPIESAKKESFNLGGKAIQLLIKDPLIPNKYHSSDARQRLWKTMLLYDAAGRVIWSHQSDDAPTSIPTSRLVAVN